MPAPQDHMRMAHGVERDCLVLEVFDQRPLQIGVGRALQAGVERLEHNLHPVRLAIARDENLREAAAAQPLRHFVAVVDQTVFKFQFRHLYLRVIESGRAGEREKENSLLVNSRALRLPLSHTLPFSRSLALSLSRSPAPPPPSFSSRRRRTRLRI